MQFGEIDSQIGHFEEILHFLRVGVVDGQVGRQDAENYFAFGGRGDARVARLANHFRQVARRLARHSRERLGAVVRKVAVHLFFFYEQGRIITSGDIIFLLFSIFTFQVRPKS